MARFPQLLADDIGEAPALDAETAASVDLRADLGREEERGLCAGVQGDGQRRRGGRCGRGGAARASSPAAGSEDRGGVAGDGPQGMVARDRADAQELAVVRRVQGEDDRERVVVAWVAVEPERARAPGRRRRR